MLSSSHTIRAALLCASTLIFGGCEEAPAPAAQPCRLEVDSPADGEVDAVFDIAYEDGRPAHATADYGQGEAEALNACISFGYDNGQLTTKTVHQGACEDTESVGAASTLQRVEGSNLVALTFPDDELTYHTVTAPGDFTFLITRTGYELGPQKVAHVDVENGLFRSLVLPDADPPHTLEAMYRGGQLIRVAERGLDGVEVGHASFHYRQERLVKVTRKLATMSEGQIEEVRLSYECDE